MCAPKEVSKEFNFFAIMWLGQKAFNIMLVGVDSREDNFDSRTDSMILIHMNLEIKNIVITSFLKDIYAEIPGHSDNRLNVAYVFGVPNLLLRTIAHKFGIEIDKYVTLSFWLVIDILDDYALGIKDYTRESHVIPVEGTWKDAKIRGMSVMEIDFEANAKAWYDTVME